MSRHDGRLAGGKNLYVTCHGDGLQPVPEGDSYPDVQSGLDFRAVTDCRLQVSHASREGT